MVFLSLCATADCCFGLFCSSFGKVGKGDVEESPPSVDRHGREAESSDPENTRTKKVKFVAEADRVAMSALRSLGTKRQSPRPAQ